jgi:hypothetical protein
MLTAKQNWRGHMNRPGMSGDSGVYPLSWSQIIGELLKEAVHPKDRYAANRRIDDAQVVCPVRGRGARIWAYTN